MNATYNFSSNRTLESLIDEPTLIRLAQQGNHEMFARLYDAYKERIYRYIYYRLSTDHELTQDITSQVFLKVWAKLGTYRIGQIPFIAWLYRIAHNAVIDHYRTKKVAISLEDANIVELSHRDEIDEKLDFQTQSVELSKALRELTQQQQQVLVLKFVNGLNTMEIARRLGKQQGAVRALQMRGLQGLAKSPTLQSGQIYAP